MQDFFQEKNQFLFEIKTWLQKFFFFFTVKKLIGNQHLQSRFFTYTEYKAVFVKVVMISGFLQALLKYTKRNDSV